MKQNVYHLIYICSHSETTNSTLSTRFFTKCPISLCGLTLQGSLIYNSVGILVVYLLSIQDCALHTNFSLHTLFSRSPPELGSPISEAEHYAYRRKTDASTRESWRDLCDISLSVKFSTLRLWLKIKKIPAESRFQTDSGICEVIYTAWIVHLNASTHSSFNDPREKTGESVRLSIKLMMWIEQHTFSSVLWPHLIALGCTVSKIRSMAMLGLRTRP